MKEPCHETSLPVIVPFGSSVHKPEDLVHPTAGYSCVISFHPVVASSVGDDCVLKSNKSRFLKFIFLKRAHSYKCCGHESVLPIKSSRYILLVRNKCLVCLS